MFCQNPFTKRLDDANRKAAVTAYKATDAAEYKERKAYQLSKDGTINDDQIRTLKKEAREDRQVAAKAGKVYEQTSLAIKILRNYFDYKLTAVLCQSLSGLTGKVEYDRDILLGRFTVAQALHIVGGKDALERRNEEGLSPEEERSQLITEALQSFESISKAAQQQGITETPLLTDNDRETLTALARVAGDKNMSKDELASKYAQLCAKLGLDPLKAKEAIREDRELQDRQAAEKIREARRERDNNGLSMER